MLRINKKNECGYKNGRNSHFGYSPNRKNSILKLQKRSKVKNMHNRFNNDLNIDLNKFSKIWDILVHTK